MENYPRYAGSKGWLALSQVLWDSILEVEMKIQVLGSGCEKCSQLADNAVAAADALGLDYEFERVSDYTRITAFYDIIPPCLVVDGHVRSVGRSQSMQELINLFKYLKKVGTDDQPING